MIVTPDHERQVEQSRAVRRQLALERCRCGGCTELTLVRCAFCESLQPVCRLVAKGKAGRSYCDVGVGCSATKGSA